MAPQHRKPAKTKRTTKKRATTLTANRKLPRHPNAGPAFAKLVALMARLRGPGGCPWDREQTHSTLRTYLIEESYEILDALDASDDAKFAEELGDLLLQVLFHSQIAHEERRFDITDVIGEIYEKMIRRHPHVFGEKRAKDAAEVLRNWEIIKREERAKSKSQSQSANTTAASQHETPESLLDGVPRTLPAVLEGYQLTRKAARVGFDWNSVNGIFDKLAEETRELREVLGKNTPAQIEAELGDLLFAAVNLARFLDVDPEIALKKGNAKFSRRFREMERLAREQGTTFAQLPRPQMESLWEESKRQEQIAHRQPKLRREAAK